MKKAILIACLAISGSVCAAHKFNPMTHRWETVPQNSELKYNVFQHNWSYQPEGTQLEYNPFEKKWEWDSGLNNGY